MPRYSAFTPYGHLSFSSKKAHGERIFFAMRNGLGEPDENVTSDFDSEAMSRIYAQAIGLSRLRHTLERAGVQFRPDRILELLPRAEDEYGLTPKFDSSIDDRRVELGRATVKPGGAVRSNITRLLDERLGADFLVYRTVPTGELVTSPPTMPGNGNFVAPMSTRGKLSRVTGSIATLATTISIAFTHVAGGLAMDPGALIVLDPDKEGLREAATVSATSPPAIDAQGDGTATIIRTDPKSHDPGALFTTAPFPFWVSTKRTALIVLSDAAARDPEKRRIVDEVMRKNARAISRWAIVDSAGATGTFKVGTTGLGLTTIGSIAI